MKYKVLSLFIIFVICVQCTPLVCAIELEQYTDDKIELELEIEKRIQQEKDELDDIMYKQLERQGALSHLPLYQKILYPRIEWKIMNQYRSTDKYNSDNSDFITRYAPNGGVAYYTLDKLTDIHCVETFLNREDTLHYILENLSGPQFTLSNLFSTILGFIPDYGSSISSMFYVLMMLDSNEYASIDDAGGYTDIFVMDQGGIESYLITGWFQYPDIVLWRDNIVSYGFDIWDEHDPWTDTTMTEYKKFQGNS